MIIREELTEILGNAGFIDFEVFLQFAIHTRRSAGPATPSCGYAMPRQSLCCGEIVSPERLSLRTLLEPSPCETRTPQAAAYVRTVSGESPE
jgi:hypothetical protein